MTEQQSSFAKIFLLGVLGGALGATLGGATGFFSARATDPTGWSEIPALLSGIIYGYGLGVGLSTFLLHIRPHAHSAFSRAFLGALGGLFTVIFLSAPLHLDAFPPLMWTLLFFFPPFIAARLFLPFSKQQQQPNDKKKED